MSCTQSAGLSLQWLRNTCCTAEQAQAEQEGRDVYALMDEMAAGVPIGAGRLLYLPYLMGERRRIRIRTAAGCFSACPRCTAALT